MSAPNKPKTAGDLIISVAGAVFTGAMVGAVAMLVVGLALSFTVGISPTLPAIAFIVPVVGAVALAISSHVSANERADQLAAAENARRLATIEQQKNESRAAELNQQRGYKNLLDNLSSRAIAAFERLPGLLRNAERHLDKAEDEFNDGVFGPFWEAIEGAAISLGAFGNTIDEIKAAAVQYDSTTRLYAGPTAPFSVSNAASDGLSTGNRTSARMQALVREAQKSFEFASIYEQRKTNSILIVGFSSLGQAINQMSTHLNSAISQLDTSVQTISTTFDRADASNQQHQREVIELSNEHIRRERDAVKILESIDRDRRSRR